MSNQFTQLIEGEFFRLTFDGLTWTHWSKPKGQWQKNLTGQLTDCLKSALGEFQNPEDQLLLQTLLNSKTDQLLVSQEWQDSAKFTMQSILGRTLEPTEEINPTALRTTALKAAEQQQFLEHLTLLGGGVEKAYGQWWAFKEIAAGAELIEQGQTPDEAVNKVWQQWTTILSKQTN
jgi:hypothetical protein